MRNTKIRYNVLTRENHKIGSVNDASNSGGTNRKLILDNHLPGGSILSCLERVETTCMENASAILSIKKLFETKLI